MSSSLQPLDIRLCSSVERGEAVIDWVLENLKAADSDKSVEAALGVKFWKVVSDEWSGFDRIDHEIYGAMFKRFRPYWPGLRQNADLPKSFEVWRGQDQCHQQVGLSWTTNKQVAGGFAIGFRYTNPDPVLYSTNVDLEDVALVLNDRDEAEVVLFEVPRAFETVGVGKDDLAQQT